jgi:DNA/RNA-binding domain of Phe-tRNA-synthetase-like protein
MTSPKRFYTIAQEVFDEFPGYVRGLVLAQDVHNGPSPRELIAILRRAEEQIREQLQLETLAQHPKMASWREAYRSFGAKPAKFRPSMEAMARRILKGAQLPSIHALVDLANVISLQHLVPVGGHATDVVEGDLFLGKATGNEVFQAFGSDSEENPLPGEIIFSQGNSVLTRRWTWRQARHTLLTPSTTAVEFNVDGLPPVTTAEVETACRELMSLLERFCGGRIRWEILTRDHPRLGLDDEFVSRS